MQLVASFLEYLVVGCTALLWVVPLAPAGVWTKTGESEKALVLLLPIVYVLGMLVDYVAEVLVSPFKKVIRSRYSAEGGAVGAAAGGLPSSTAFVLLRSADLGRELQARSTRDRIARGTFLNLVVVAVVVWIADLEQLPASRFGISAVAFTAAAMAFGMWWRFESLTLRFRRKAVATILWADAQHSGPAWRKPGPRGLLKFRR
jgi:hypothetical protein